MAFLAITTCIEPDCRCNDRDGRVLDSFATHEEADRALGHPWPGYVDSVEEE